MDANINNGVGVVWGITTGKTTPGQIESSSGIQTGTGYLMIVEQDFAKTRQSEPHQNADGSVIGETYYRKESTLRMRLYPSGVANADAKAANAKAPEPGTEVTLVDPGDPELVGQWSVTDVSKQHRWADKVYWDLNLRRWGNNFVVGSSGQRISGLVSDQAALQAASMSDESET